MSSCAKPVFLALLLNVAIILLASEFCMANSPLTFIGDDCTYTPGCKIAALSPF